MTDGYEPRWDLDLPYGEEGEQIVRNLLDLDSAHVEVKRKRRLDLKLYVETAQRSRGSIDFRRSGINTTEAEAWAYVIGDTGVVLFVPTEILKQAALLAPEAEERDGDNPTKGRLVDVDHLFPRRNANAA